MLGLPISLSIFEYSVLLFSSVQSLNRVRLFVSPLTAARQASLSITNSWSPPKPMSIESVMPSNHLILCHHYDLQILKFKSFPQSSLSWIHLTLIIHSYNKQICLECGQANIMLGGTAYACCKRHETSPPDLTTQSSKNF